MLQRLGFGFRLFVAQDMYILEPSNHKAIVFSSSEKQSDCQNAFRFLRERFQPLDQYVLLRNLTQLLILSRTAATLHLNVLFIRSVYCKSRQYTPKT